MEIILMRHGKPAFTASSRVTSLKMAEWISQYNLCDTGSDMPPQFSKTLASCALHIISSPLPRARSSLTALGREPDLIDEVFREADLPVFHIPAFRLPPIFWASVFRIMWFCGISRNVESLGIAKQRAVQAADILVTSVKVVNGPVLLMGHWVMNRLIAKELVSMGWKEYRRQGNGYWNAVIYSLL
ncbi:phosphoglycerate mutase family protein [Citrobacter sp. Ct235]|uniref:histidine phosphatase family protein n=1 Tax=Citrobacter sp. Ct235 TaxID=2985157 RepID=UPI002577A380|nr:histidine phosphatase family protein [Citrobacter sp. Ct235]MDM2737410.1 phosphoglycerate mutase family protein [Citrobacter sp. Ct235]